MPPQFSIVPGLPPYGPPAATFPEGWGSRGREGTIVHFDAKSGSWTANFKPGLQGLTEAMPHSNGRDVIVISSGDLWVVDPESRRAEYVLTAIELMFKVEDPPGWVFSCQGIAFARMGSNGVMWRTERLSWDGFAEIEIVGFELSGKSWTRDGDRWIPFRIDLRTGKSIGGGLFTRSVQHLKDFFGLKA